MAKKKIIFFATDVHGSEKCFKKFVNAGKIYGTDICILGGDITGKMMVPFIEQQNGTYTAFFLGTDHIYNSIKEVEESEKILHGSGIYTFRTNLKEYEDLSVNKTKTDTLFKKLMIERLQSWVNFTDERLKDTGIRVFITGGNDDPLEIESFLKAAVAKTKCIADPEGEVVSIDENHEMVSSGYCNMTPWKCPRDLPDDQLGQKIMEMIPKVNTMKNCIFNLHAPPFNSNLDIAPRLDGEMRPESEAGGYKMEPVGSKSVKTLIEKYQPLIGLHGHIHESRAFNKIGRTICFNPGSEYGEGVLRGVLITLSDKGVDNFVFTYG